MTAESVGYTEATTDKYAAEYAAFSAEELRPELIPYLEDGPLGPQLRHPLVYQVPLFTNGHANRMLEQKLEAIKKARAEKNYALYVYMHERPYRLHAFRDFVESSDVPDEIYSEIAGDIFTDAENAHQNLEEWKRILRSPRVIQKSIMREEDYKLYEELPNDLVIYRGCVSKNENGLSWTLSKEKAEWFASRFGKTGHILEARIEKSNAIALLNHRNEQEIICYADPKYIRLQT